MKEQSRKKRIKFINIAATIFAGLIISGCSGKNSGSTSGLSKNSDLLAQIRARGEIVVAMEGTWAPWTYHDENSGLTGFDVETARLIAQKLGVKVKFAEGEWSGLFAGLDSGRYDMVINGVEITPERKQKYDFTEPYAFIRTALVVRKDNNSIRTFSDLAGKKTANSIESTYMTLAESFGATAAGVETLDQTMELVLTGRADATLNAEVSYADYMRVHQNANLKIAALTEEASDVCIPIRKGKQTEQLRIAVNQAIEELHKNGELKAVSEKYFGRDITSVK